MPRKPDPAASASTLPEQIKAARAKLGLSQSEAAEKWDVNVRTLQSWEIGDRQPRGFARKHLDQLLRRILGSGA